MKLLMRHKWLFAVIIALIFAVAMTITGLALDGFAPPSGNIVNIMFRPFSMLSMYISDLSASIYNAQYRYDELLAENKRLRERITEIEESARDVELVREENERLNNFLGFSKKHPLFTYAPCAITVRDISNWSRSFMLGSGSDDGIAPKQCVVDEYGNLVGVISEVGTNWSVMTTIVDTDIDFGAYVFRTKQLGICEGDFDLSRRSLLRLSFLPTGVDLQNDDLVFSSGVGGLYPADIEIGRVSEVYADASGLSSYAVITPSADIDSITHVFVITSFSAS